MQKGKLKAQNKIPQNYKFMPSKMLRTEMKRKIGKTTTYVNYKA